MRKPYILHGWHLSYFAGKTRAYLRYKGLPFVDHPVDALNLLWRIPRKTGAKVMPVLVTPEGEWLQDSKHICEVIESRFPQRPVTPSTPRQLIAALLLEAWADEWWMPSAMHYRWSFPENYPLFERDSGDALLPGFPRFFKDRIAAYVARTLRGYLPAVGVLPQQFALMERWTEGMLDALERHFSAHAFLLGGRPCIADFALFGPLYGHLGRDPWPRKHLVEPRPSLKSWVERMGAVEGAKDQGDWLADDALPASLQPLFDSVFREFWPMVLGIREETRKILPQLRDRSSRLPRALPAIEFPMADGRFHRAAMPYTLWMMQRIADRYRGLDAAGRDSVDAWLRGQGGPKEIVQSDPGLRLERAGLHVRLAA